MEEMFNNIEIEINSECNRKCSYCPNYKHERMEQGEMKESLFRKIIEQLKDIGYRDRITYHFYGEPLLCKNLDKYIRITTEKLPDAYPVLFSNGDFLSNDRLKKLEDCGVKYFVITQHEGLKHEFEQVYNNLADSMRDKVFYRKYEEINYNNRGGLIDVCKGETDMLFNPCTLPSTMVQITLKGNILPCCNDFEQRNVMGNISKHSLMKIWESCKFKEFRKNLFEGRRNLYLPCKNCDM